MGNTTEAGGPVFLADAVLDEQNIGSECSTCSFLGCRCGCAMSNAIVSRLAVSPAAFRLSCSVFQRDTAVPRSSHRLHYGYLHDWHNQVPAPKEIGSLLVTSRFFFHWISLVTATFLWLDSHYGMVGYCWFPHFSPSIFR